MQLKRRLSLLIVSALLAPMGVVAVSTSANAAAPANDDIATAISATASNNGTTVDATDQTGEYKADSQYQSTVWYYYEPASSGSVQFDSCGSTATTHLDVFNSQQVNYPASLAVPTNAPTVASTGTSCTNGQKVTITVTAFSRYFIQVSTQNGANRGAFVLNIAASSGGNNNNNANPNTALAKVTICHRTHSVTNPYVIINVSTSSIVDAASAVNGHGWHDDVKTRMGKGIFNPPYAKPSLKMWGDIIPPFIAANGGVFNGLNWHWGSLAETGDNLDKTEFRAIDATTAAVSGTAQYMIDALKLCQGAAGDKTAKELYEIERKSGQKKQDILDEMETEDKASVETTLPSSEGPKKAPKNVPTQSLSGNVWLDLNRNGLQETNEPNMPNIAVTVAPTDPSLAAGFINRISNTGGGKGVIAAASWLEQFPIFSSVIGQAKALIRTATTYKVLTDANGWYIFKSIGAGDWTAVGVVPNGLEVTYDSTAASDASVDATVPVSGHAHTWIGLVGPATIEAPITNPDGSPVTEKVTIEGAGPDGKFGTDDDVTYEVTPVDGKIVLDGIPEGQYRIVKIGSSYYTQTFTVGSTKFTSVIAPKKTTKAQLAATGANLTDSTYVIIGLAVSMIVAGGLVLRRRG